MTIKYLISNPDCRHAFRFKIELYSTANNIKDLTELYLAINLLNSKDLETGRVAKMENVCVEK